MPSTAGPTISVVTVCLNAASVIEDTLRSVLSQDYPLTEYVVVDGGSTDGTVEALRKYSGRIAAMTSAPDRGVYDAMNKALGMARGDYLLFLNAGDVLASPQVIGMAARGADADVVYGDFEYSSGPRKGRVVADVDRGIFNHQCVLYRKSLHEAYGGYCAVKGFTAADYLFFMQLRATERVTFRKLDFVFSVVDPYGMSSGLQTFLQVNLVDCLLGRRSRYATAFRIAVHPLYHFVRKAVGRIW